MPFAERESLGNQEDAMPASMREIRGFWENNLLCAHLIEQDPGSIDFFEIYDRMREEIDPEDFIEEWLSPSKSAGQTVLDIGCGNGYIMSKFARSGAQVFGLDISESALAVTRRRLNLLNLKGDLLQVDAAWLPFADSSFDLVYSLGVLHHSPYTEACFREIYRVLRPGGKVVVMMYNKNSVFYRLRIPAMKFFNPAFKGWSIQKICNYLDGPGNPLGRFFDRAQIRGMMQGFKGIRFQPRFFSHLHFPGKPNIFPKSLCCHIGNHFGWLLYASGVKKSRLKSPAINLASKAKMDRCSA